MAVGTEHDRAYVQVCRDRACTMIVWAAAVTGTSTAVGTALGPGVWYWQLFGIAGTTQGTVPSYTWEFAVPGNQHATHNSNWGNVLDFNGDGYADALVIDGNDNADVFYGGSSGLPTAPSYTYALGAPYFVAVDINGDGYTDLVSARSSPCSTYFGGPSGLPIVPAASTCPSVGGTGQPLYYAGDVNGDGYGDLLAGPNSGANGVTIWYGSAGGLSSAASGSGQISDPNGSGNSFGSGYGGFGAIASAGDVNGDGYADIVVGSLGYPASAFVGIAYVFAGSSNGPSATPTTINAPGGGMTEFGVTVAGIGDVNGDGYEDIAVGNHASGGPSVYVFLGSPSGVATTPSRTLNVGAYLYFSDGAIAAAGDVNADGYSDLLIGDSDYGAAGGAFVYNGGSGGIGSSPSTTFLALPNYNGTGNRVAGLGDTNRDGYQDIAITASGGTLTGVFVSLGSMSGPGALGTPPLTVFAPAWVFHM